MGSDGGAHGAVSGRLGAAKVSKRRLASWRSSAVIVMYTAVELGLTCPRKVARWKRRPERSTPARYHRNTVPTANACRRSWRRDGHSQPGHEVVKGLADRPGMDRSATRE